MIKCLLEAAMLDDVLFVAYGLWKRFENCMVFQKKY